MVSEIDAPIKTIQDQKAVIQGTTNYKLLKNFYSEYFADKPGGLWFRTLDAVFTHDNAEEYVEAKLSPDYFRLHALVGSLSNEFGYPRMEGQLFRHNARDFNKLPFTPKHEFALACYLGALNAQTYSIKESIANRYPDFKPAIWGTAFTVRDGQVIEPARPEGLKLLVTERSKSSRPICLPNKPLNYALAQVAFPGENRRPFTSHDADTIDDDTFKTVFLPQARRAMGEYLDVDSAFTVTRDPHRFYSTP